MNIGKFMDELHISSEIGTENFYSSGMQDIPEEVPVKEKEASTYQFKGWKRLFAQLLMKGFHAKDIKAKFNTNIKVASITDDADKFLKSKDGLVGTLFVDCSAFDNDFKYKDINAKYKQYNRYAINCGCKNVVVSKVRKYAEDGSIDGLLNNQENLVIHKREICPECGLPVIHSLKEIPEDVLKETVDLLVANNEISFKLGEEIKNSKNILGGLRKAFSRLGLVSIKKSSDKVDNSFKDFALKEERLEADSIKQSNDLEINPLKEERVIGGELVFDEVVPQDVNQLSENGESLENFNMNGLDICLVDDMVDKENNQVEFDVVNPEGIIIVDLAEPEKDDIGEIVKNDIDVENKNNEVLNVDVFAKPSKIEVDNDEYVDDDYFSKDQIEFGEDEFENQKEELKVSNKYSFDF